MPKEAVKVSDCEFSVLSVLSSSFATFCGEKTIVDSWYHCEVWEVVDPTKTLGCPLRDLLAQILAEPDVINAKVFSELFCHICAPFSSIDWTKMFSRSPPTHWHTSPGILIN